LENKFKTKEARENAEKNYLKHKERIESHNVLYKLGKLNYDMAENEYAYMSSDEFMKTMTGFKEDTVTRIKRAVPQYYATTPTCTTYPPYKNWAEEGIVQRVKDQTFCGDCYIFAALGVLESAVARKYQTSPPDLSEQHMLDCGTKGCNGGSHTDVWPLTATYGGVVRTADYNPYSAVKGPTCNWNLPKDERAVMDKWYQLRVGNEAVAPCYLNENGPLWVIFCAAKDLHTLGPNGIYDNADGACLINNCTNHAVMLVGYGTETNALTGVKTDYWILKNSWGTTWGKKIKL
jgi:C1A family cysteine protease